MKKFLVLCIGIVSVFGIHTVKADTYVATRYYENFENAINVYNTYKDNIDVLIDYYNTNWKEDYPYYFIDYCHRCAILSGTSSSASFIILYPLIDNNVSIEQVTSDYYIHPNIPNKEQWVRKRVLYIPEIDKYDYEYKYGNFSSNFLGPLVSNTKFVFKSTEKFNAITIPSFSSDSLNVSYDEFEIKENNIIPTFLDLYNNIYKPVDDSYVEVNLNNYAYIALSLKDYTKEISNSYSEYSNIYVKGQLCATPVYNYGQTERKDILTGSKVQACSLYNLDYTLTRFYILPSDIKNHAIYYLKAYDTTKDNYVKIDTSYFDITYITEENKDNPQVSIDGKIYPTLSYDKLTDTSTKSEDEGYVSGVSCAVGDFNCYSEYNPSNAFKDIFDKPLEALKSVWSAIINVFELIKMFIMLLPQTLQSFLYLSFMIAIVLGIIKIIL